jgi:hypothetical protein
MDGFASQRGKVAKVMEGCSGQISRGKCLEANVANA